MWADLCQAGNPPTGSSLRICIFSPDMHETDRYESFGNALLSVSEPQKIDFTFLTGYPWAQQGSEATEPYVMAGSARIKMRVCRKFLQVRPTIKWVPPFLGFLAVHFSEKEIIEALLGSDPDVIVCCDSEWLKHLVRLLRKRNLPWHCVTEDDRIPHVSQYWRQYDPSAKVSIVLPTYNGSKFLRQSIESCLCQSHRNLELLIVDDGSGENIYKIVRGYEDVRVKYLRHKKNLGLPTALNTGFREATGNYLTWTSDDNYYAPNAIEEMVRFLQTYSSVDFVYAESYLLDERVQNQALRIRRILPPEDLQIKNEIGACFLYSRQVFETVGEYNSTVYLAEDYEYWMRVAQRFRMQRLFRPLYYYRFHQDSLTSKYAEKVREATRMVRQLHSR